MRTHTSLGATMVVSVAVAIGAVVGYGGEARGNSSADAGLTALAEAAGTGSDATAGVAALTKAAHTPMATATYAPFLYSSPTLGCGSGSGPFTFTASAGAGEYADRGSLRLQADPAYSGVPTASTLTVAWINLSTGAEGIAPLDDTTQYRLPSLSKTVRTGPGVIVAALWGSVDYTDAICSVAPTVGTFTTTVWTDSS